MRIDRVRLVAAMARNDLNVNQLAKQSGVSRCTVTAVRGGKSCSAKTAEKLASILGNEILKGVSNNETNAS